MLQKIRYSSKKQGNPSLDENVWIHFCHVYVKSYSFFNIKNECFSIGFRHKLINCYRSDWKSLLSHWKSSLFLWEILKAFSQINKETMDIVQSIGNLLTLNINNNDMVVLSTAFDLNSDMFKTEINLLKHKTKYTENKKKTNDWVNLLTESNYRRETIFCNVVQALKTFMVIPCNELFSRTSISELSIVKT